jgi:hypothetical protein
MGYRLQALMLFDILVETFVACVCPSLTDPIWISVVFFLQQPLDYGCCLYRLRFLIEPFCSCLPLRAALRKAHIIFRSIAYYLFLSVIPQKLAIDIT